MTGQTKHPATTPIKRRGMMLVLSSPSGAGKTTLAHALLAAEANIKPSISVTTRKARPGEVEGRDYFFLEPAEFARRRGAGELLEWAEVFDNAYGTPKAAVEAHLTAGCDVLFDIDWQGTQQLTARVPDDLVRVFILPPDGKALETRLRDRNQDAPDVVARRMAKAAGEISHWTEYDYVIVNEDVGHSLATLRAILAAERARRTRQEGLAAFVTGVLAGL